MKKLSNAGKKALLLRSHRIMRVILLREERCHCCQEDIMALQNNIMQVKKLLLASCFATAVKCGSQIYYS